MVTTVNEQQKVNVNDIKRKLPYGWTNKLAQKHGVSRKTVSWVFRKQKFFSPIWKDILKMAESYDALAEQVKKASKNSNDN